MIAMKLPRGDSFSLLLRRLLATRRLAGFAKGCNHRAWLTHHQMWADLSIDGDKARLFDHTANDRKTIRESGTAAF